MSWKRICASLLLILSFIFAPFWLTLVFLVFFLYYFDYYVEGVFLFFLADLTYGIPLARFGDFPFAMTVIALGLFLLSLIIKPFLLER